ncbi:hypothetical protein [Acidovorax kalamii]|uniref:hypothetical protein n=1 Tax=Acidovorax kalamii TaxID=2004485 RepID=UPI002091A975|nr:hypothetical protein [Acidovorax kalamii]MCO5356559.1 hypothetical protein [Acidovorax kalamii]
MNWQSVGWRTTKRIVAEAAIPAIVSLGFTAFSLNAKLSWTWAEAIQTFGGTFFFAAYFINYGLRVHKQVQDADRHSAVVGQQQELLAEMRATARDVAAYATGGDSFIYVESAVIEEYGSQAFHVARINCLVNGKYPLFDVNVTMMNLDHPGTRAGLRESPKEFTQRNTLLVGTVVPGFLHGSRVSIPLLNDRPNRLAFNWQARNGSWHQRVEIVRRGEQWVQATFVERGVPGAFERIHQQASAGFELDAQGEPVFDMSPTGTAEVASHAKH